MSATRFGFTCYLTLAVLAGAGMAATAGTAATQMADARSASRLLSGIAADARAVQMEGNKLETLARSGAPTFQEYDYRWNLIKPKVEEMRAKLERLEQMRAELLPWQQQAIDRSASLIQRISSNTEKIYTLINSDNLSSPIVETYGQNLSREAHELVNLAWPGGNHSSEGRSATKNS